MLQHGKQLHRYNTMTITASFPSVIPSLSLDFANSGVLDNRITFTRSTTGTYYNGYSSAVAEQNLLLQSQTFNTTWGASFATLVANSIVAPDGTTTAYTMTSASSSSFTTGILQSGVSTATGLTYSIYAKVGTSNFVCISTNTSTAIYANFNVSTGAVASSAGCTASIVSVGNGWYRCVMANTTLVGNGYATIVGKDADPAGNPWTVGTQASGNNVYIWGAQLENRSTVTAYNATTTTAITNYIPVLQTGAINQARFDHNPTTGESLGLLIEQQSTNLLLQSQFASGWIYVAASGTLTANIAPDGTQTAVKLVENAVNTTHYIYQSYIFTAATFTGSFYLKTAGRTWARITIQDTVSEIGAYFDLTNGVTGTVDSGITATITSVGNGWYRCSVSRTTAAGLGYVNSYPCSANATAGYTGNGYSGIYIWGAQLEALAFPTSYIPTVASQVTRSADSASMTGANFSSWYNNSVGTLYCDFIAPTTQSPCLGIGKNTFNDTMAMNTVNLLRFAAVAPFLTLGTAVSGTNKIAATLAVGNFVASNNGLAVVTSTALTNIQQSANTLNIGGTYTGGGYLNGTIKKLAYYPIAVSSANLIALTGS